MSEPTKACVRVLRLEAKFRYVLWYPFNKLGKLFWILFESLEFLLQYVNWCIVRAVFRWIGPVLTVVAVYTVLNIMDDNPHPSQILMLLVVGGMATISFIGFITLVSWLNIPYKESEIINGHFKELSGEKK